MTPQVSIIMPVLNGERYITEAIESVCSQTYTAYELLVVDDGSTDRTRDRVLDFARRLDLKYVRHEKPQGIAPSMNDGVRQSSGAFITFLDHDDLWVPDFLAMQLSYLQQHPEVGMVHSDIQTIDAQGNVLEHSVAKCRQRLQPSGKIFRELFMHSMICGITVMIRRECFDRVGLFDESLYWGDYHMWLRIARHYRIDYVDTVLAKYRQHETQSTRDKKVQRPDTAPVGLQTIEKILEMYPEVRDELGDEAIRHRTASFYFDLAYRWYRSGDRSAARVCLRRAIRLWPTNSRYLRLYAATLMGLSGVKGGARGSMRMSGVPADQNNQVGEIRG